jgi:hypothetical protein
MFWAKFSQHSWKETVGIIADFVGSVGTYFSILVGTIHCGGASE